MYKYDKESCRPNKMSHPPQPQLEHSTSTQSSRPETEEIVDNWPETNWNEISHTEFSDPHADQQEETHEEQMMAAATQMIEEKARELITELLQSIELNLENLSSKEQRCQLRRNLLGNHRNFLYLPENFRDFFVFTKCNSPINVEKARLSLQTTLKRYLKNIKLIEALIAMNYIPVAVGKSRIVATTDKEAFINSLKNLLNNGKLSAENCQEITHWFTTATLDLIFLKAINKELIQKCREKSLEIAGRINTKLNSISVLESYCSNYDETQMVGWLKFWKKDKKFDINEAVNRMMDLTRKEQTITEKLQLLTYEFGALSKMRIP